MKSLKFRRPLKLNARGVAHYIVPLVIVLAVAIVGTYLLISSHADPTTSRSANTSSVSRGKAYLVLYNNWGVYDAAKITVVSPSTKTVNCGGSLSSSHPTVDKSLPHTIKNSVAVPVQFTCAPISGTTQFNIAFGKQSSSLQSAGFSTDDFGTYQAVDVDNGYCTIVHPNPALTHKVPVGPNGCAYETDLPTKVDVAMRSLPALTGNKKGITGYIELSVPNVNLPRTECSGEVSVAFTPQGGATSTFNNPLKYTKPAGITNGYCVATIATDVKIAKAGTTYTVAASYGGSIYFNSQTASATIAIPAAKAATATHVGGTN